MIRVPAVIKTWGDAVRRESLGICHGQSTVIGRVLRVGNTGKKRVFSGLSLTNIFFRAQAVLRQCLGSASAVEQPPTAIPSHKARPSQNWPTITTYDHVHQIFITSCTWFRRGVLCDQGFTDIRGHTNIFHWRLHRNVTPWTLLLTLFNFNLGMESHAIENGAWNYLSIHILQWYNR